MCPNSMDAVSDRDFVADAVYMSTMHLLHLSRFAEDLIIYSSGQFGFVQCSDAYATGSSLMPQKKNPDALELMRGKAGRAQGNLMGVLSVLKGTPTTYNKDFQEVWPLMFDSVDTLHDCVCIATGVVSTLTIRPQRMAAGLSADMLATDLAEYLVRKGTCLLCVLLRSNMLVGVLFPPPGVACIPCTAGVPFRETHHISGAAVKMAEDRCCALSDLTVADLQSIHPLFAEDVTDVWDFTRSADARDSEGGASKRSVLEQVAKINSYLATEA